VSLQRDSYQNDWCINRKLLNKNSFFDDLLLGKREPALNTGTLS